MRPRAAAGRVVRAVADASGPWSAGPGPAEPGYDADVLVVGAGPAGCWLAAELCAAGLRVIVIEARERRAEWSRGFVVHPRTVEILASRGIAAPLLEAAQHLPNWHFAMSTQRLDFSVLPTAFPVLLLHPQARTEELLERRLERHGGRVVRGARAVGLRQDAGHVEVLVTREGEAHTLTARFVVGCDGARSAVREAAGIAFTGNPDTLTSPSALVRLADPPPPERYMQTTERGVFFVIPLPNQRFVVSTIDHAAMHEVDVPWTGERLRESLLRIVGTDYGMGEPERVSTLGNSAKQADRYREGRVLLAGDAAHVHFPMGGQGLNLGIQDVHNLAWRLIGAVRADRRHRNDDLTARRVAALLDGYEAERRPAGERVLEDVRAQMALVAASGPDGAALRGRFEALLREHASVNLQYALRLSGLDVRYPTAEGTRAQDRRVGARVPELRLECEGGEAGLYELLAKIGSGRFVYLTAGGDGAQAASDLTRDQLVDVVPVSARAILGPQWAREQGWGGAEAVLIRPDGHVASTGGPVEAAAALDSLFGSA